MTPQQHLASASTDHPSAWRYLDEVRAGRGRNGLPGWPEWCFAPSEAIGVWLKTVAPRCYPVDVARLTTLGAWRATQGIYRFSPQLEASLIEAPPQTAVPTALLLKLPEWAVYIETRIIANSDGFWATLEYDNGRPEGNRIELRLLIDMRGQLVPAILHLPSSGTLDDALAGIHSKPTIDPADQNRWHQMMSALFVPRLPLLLYLCGERPEISGSWPPARPEPVSTRRKGLRLYPPKKPVIWQVG